MKSKEELIETLKIYTIRNQSVVLDNDLASIYKVTTGNFNKAVRRNLARFPEEFSFVLTDKEFTNLIFQFGRSKGRGERRKPPRVFTEPGALMASFILNSDRSNHPQSSRTECRRELAPESLQSSRGRDSNHQKHPSSKKSDSIEPFGRHLNAAKQE
ncbi:MAG: ORF6N domain-containing protein [Verrucomicrobia bacterium]|nr:ORF6N domain-containing protein [Verrucomicrobiota bacterium]